MFYTLSSRLLVPPNTIFVTDHTIGYFVNVLPDWLIVILSLACYIVICIDWLYVHFDCFVFVSHVEVRFDISLIKELIDWLIYSCTLPVPVQYNVMSERNVCDRQTDRQTTTCAEDHFGLDLMSIDSLHARQTSFIFSFLVTLTFDLLTSNLLSQLLLSGAISSLNLQFLHCSLPISSELKVQGGQTDRQTVGRGETPYAAFSECRV